MGSYPSACSTFSTCLVSSFSRTSTFTMKLHEFSQFKLGLLEHFNISNKDIIKQINRLASLSFLLLKKILFTFFLERRREGEREGEKHQCVVAFHALPTGDLAGNLGVCPDWELNWRSSGSQASAQSTEVHQPGQQAFSMSSPMPSGIYLLTTSLQSFFCPSRVMISIIFFWIWWTC